MTQLLRKQSKLTKLNLSNLTFDYHYDGAVDSRENSSELQFLAWLGECCPKMETLDLEFKISCDITPILMLIKKMPSLHSLRLVFHDGWNKTESDSDNTQYDTASLHTLVLRGTGPPSTTNILTTNFLLRCTDLKSVTFDWDENTRRSDDEMYQWMRMHGLKLHNINIQLNPNTKTRYGSGNNNPRSTLLQGIMEYCSSLVSLHINGDSIYNYYSASLFTSAVCCATLTTLSFENIQTTFNDNVIIDGLCSGLFFPSLRELAIISCRAFSPEAIQKVVDTIQLRKIHLTFMPQNIIGGMTGNASIVTANYANLLIHLCDNQNAIALEELEVNLSDHYHEYFSPKSVTLLRNKWLKTSLPHMRVFKCFVPLHSINLMFASVIHQRILTFFPAIETFRIHFKHETAEKDNFNIFSSSKAETDELRSVFRNAQQKE